MAWMVCFGALAVAYLMIALRERPTLAMAMVVPLGFAFPAWVQLQLFSLPDNTVVGAGVDVKVAIGICALVCYSFLPRATFPLKLVTGDYAMLTLLAVHGISDCVNSGASWSILLRMYAEWFVPYLCGRLAFQYRRDLAGMWPVMVAVAVFLALSAIFEAISHINIYEIVFGLRPEEQTPREAVRWGLRRAYGPCLNPIYFGLLQLLLLGWSMQAAHRALLRRAHLAWLITPVLSVAGIICTGSRGPIIGLLLFALAVLFIRMPRSRWPLVATAILSVIFVIAQRERVVVALEKWSGEADRNRTTKNLVVNEDSVMKFSGTRSRLIMLEMYRVALLRSGLIGYGTSAVTGFPINVPIGPQDIDTLRRVRYIDNEYVLLTLRFGYLGLLSFVALGVTSAWTLTRLHDRYAHENLGLVVAYVGAGLMCVLVVIFTVWMPHDYGFALLWTMGASSGLAAAEFYGYLGSTSRKQRREEVDEDEDGEDEDMEEDASS